MLLSASYYDFKKREIPDYLNFSFLGLAFLLRLLNAVYEPIILSIAVFFGAYLLMYRTGQWGGGDVKLLTACAMAFGWQFFRDYGINLIFSTVIYSMLFVMFVGMKNFAAIKRKYGRKKAYFIIVLILSSTAYAISAGSLQSILTASSVFLIALAPVVIFVDRELMIKEVETKELTEGDWLVKPVKVEDITIEPRKIGLTIEDLKIIKKHKGKVLIRYGVPLAPAFLIAFIWMFSSYNFAELVFNLYFQ